MPRTITITEKDIKSMLKGNVLVYGDSVPEFLTMTYSKWVEIIGEGNPVNFKKRTTIIHKNDSSLNLKKDASIQGTGINSGH